MTIVCAIDGSRYSQWTLDWLQRIHAHRNGSLLLVHAVDMTQFKTFPQLKQKARSALVKVLFHFYFISESIIQGHATMEWTRAGSFSMLRIATSR